MPRNWERFRSFLRPYSSLMDPTMLLVQKVMTFDTKDDVAAAACASLDPSRHARGLAVLDVPVSVP